MVAPPYPAISHKMKPQEQQQDNILIKIIENMNDNPKLSLIYCIILAKQFDDKKIKDYQKLFIKLLKDIKLMRDLEKRRIMVTNSDMALEYFDDDLSVNDTYVFKTKIEKKIQEINERQFDFISEIIQKEGISFEDFLK